MTAIRGNVDKEPWARKLPETEVVELAGISIYVLHDLAKLDLKPEAAGFKVVHLGHSHVPKQETHDGVLYFNPGSAGPRRFKLPVTVWKAGCSAAEGSWRDRGNCSLSLRLDFTTNRGAPKSPRPLRKRADAVEPPQSLAAARSLRSGSRGERRPPLHVRCYNRKACRSNFTSTKLQAKRAGGGLLTPHAEIETPVFMPVGTVASVKGVPQETLGGTRARRSSWEHLSPLLAAGS